MGYPLGNVWPVGDSKTYGVTDPPGSCAYRDPMQAFMAASGGAFVGTLAGGSNGIGTGVLTPCTISGLALLGDGHSGFTCVAGGQGGIQPNIGGWFSSISATPPKFGIMYAGTNDLTFIATSVPGYNIDRLYTDFATMLATAVALNPALPWFVCNMDPMPQLVIIPEWNQFNAFIGALVKQYQRQGSPMYLIDLAGAPGITYNSGGIHQDVAGYAATSARMVAALQTLRPAG